MGKYYSRRQKELHFSKWGNVCAYCGASGVFITTDHFIAKSKGGSNKLCNLVPCCVDCNQSKADKNPFDWYSKQLFYKLESMQKILILLSEAEEFGDEDFIYYEPCNLSLAKGQS